MPNPKKTKQDNMYFEPYLDGNDWKFKLTRIVKSKIEQNVTIPAFVDGIPVCFICSEAFSESKVVTVVFPESIEFIGPRAFYNCKFLESVKSYNGLANPARNMGIGQRAFWGCIMLKDFTATVPVSFVGDMAFQHCNQLQEVNAKIKELGSNVFIHCHQLAKITIDHRGSWRSDSFVYAKKLKTLALVGTVDVGKSALKAVLSKTFLCTEKFNHLDLAYSGVKMYISEDIV